ncbi:MAG: cation transporter [Erysipelotrichaceae bacterium]|nr:cation transporter [Erysipelotrichaceae bacterium]
MMNFLIKRFIKDYKQVENAKVREQYGFLVSIVSIVLNIILATSKLIVGFIANSISIQADALNNYSDVGSNLATLFGFKLASKHPDADHPYGHGRMEYISGLIISFLIFLVAFQSLKEALIKIVQPVAIQFSYISAGILVMSIVVKLYMGFMNKEMGERINSSSLKAASQDSFNDTITTIAALVSMLLSHYASLNLDGWFGLFVSLFVLKAGIEVFKDTTNPLLGQAPDKKIVNDIEKLVLSHEGILGIHDLMMHDYGPGRSFVTLHAEVDCHADLSQTHDEIDLIEREILENFNIHATLHMDPIDYKNEIVNELKEKVTKIIKSINDAYTLHDFRIVTGPTHTNILFDVVIPTEDTINVVELKKTIDNKIKEINPTYYSVIDIDRSYY